MREKTERINWVESLLFAWGAWASRPVNGYPKQVAWSRMAPPNQVFTSRIPSELVSDDLAAMDKAIRSLPPCDVAVIVCVYAHRHSLRATARHLGGTYNGVRDKLLRLHGTLAERFGEMQART